MNSLIIVLGLISMASAFAQDRSTCEKTRAAFVLGTEKFQLKVARVDTCKKKILSIVREKTVQMDLPQYLDAKSKLISAEDIERSRIEIVNLINEAKTFGVTEFYVLAHKIFTHAENTQALLDDLKQEISVDEKSDLPVVVFKKADDKLEASILHASVDAKLNHHGNLIVWEIRQNGMQLVRRSEKGSLKIYQAPIGSRSIDKSVSEVLAVAKGNDEKVELNYFKKDAAQIQVATKMDNRFKRELNDRTRGLIDLLDTKKPMVVGVGNVLETTLLGIEKKKHEDRIDYNELRETLIGEFEKFGVDPTYHLMMLVFGMMDSTGINEVTISDYELSDGVLLLGLEP